MEEKTFTTMAPVLDYFIISARMEGREEVGEFVIQEYTRVSIEETWDSVAMRGTASHDLVLQNVEIDNRFYGCKRRESETKGYWLVATYTSMLFRIGTISKKLCSSVCGIIQTK